MNESDNNRSDSLTEGQESYTDPYVAESSADIYATPEVVETVEEADSVEVVDTHGLFSGRQPENSNSDFYTNYSGQPSYGNGQQGSNQQGNPYNPYGGQTPYGNGQTPYGNGQQANPYNPYGGQSSYGSGQQENPYNPYGGQTPYGNGQQGNPYNPYGGQPPYGNGQTPYGNGQQENPYNPYDGQSSYGNGQQGTPYGNPYPQGGGYGGQPPFGGQPPYDNPYSPYASPQKKPHTGLIVGIVITIVVLFLIAIFALASKAVNMLSDKEKEELRQDVYDFDDDYEYDIDDYLYDYDDDYFDYDDDYDDDYDYDYDYDDDRYYTLHDEIRDDLSYGVEFSGLDYETDYENVYIAVSMPVVLGEDVKNLGTINEEIQREAYRITEFFEEEYESHIKENEDAYFEVVLEPYVAYMDEDKLSIVYDERIYSDLDSGVYLICVNVDMKNGVVLDNEDMLAVDDDFTVEFRTKCDEQNGEVDALSYMTDQQITSYFTSDNLIVFYTPKGMEIGFNYEEGWVTVTYEEYEQYLNVF